MYNSRVVFCILVGVATNNCDKVLFISLFKDDIDFFVTL